MIILIADDDRLIRFTMKSMLSELLQSDYVFLEASNGKEMVDVCRKYYPDIIFADIKMPYMDGITAIEECQKYSKHTEFVVISGYSEFEYAKRCIKLGINDYLLKPVEEEQLAELVKKIEQKRIQSGKEANSRFKLRLFEAFNQFSTMGTEEAVAEFERPDGWDYIVAGFLIECSANAQQEHMKCQKRIMKALQEFADSSLKRDGYYTTLYSEEGTLYCCFCVNPGVAEKLEDQIRRITRKESERQLLHTVVFSGADLKKIYKKSRETDSEMSAVLNYPSGAVLTLEQFEDDSRTKESLECIREMMQAWENMDMSSYTNKLNQLKKLGGGKVNWQNISAYCRCVMEKEFSVEDFAGFCARIQEEADSMYKNGKENRGGLTERIKEFVKKYYMNDISVSQIAEEFQLTPNYISAIFHQETGEKFIDYLTRIRMDNAKRLLVQNRTASVKDIAVMCGYNSPRYFSELFQKQNKMTPSAYRKMHD